MRIIHGKVGSGKTTRLIQNVKEFGGVLVVSSRRMKDFLISSGTLAKGQVVTFQEKHGAHDGRRYWIDQVDMVLEEMFGPGCEGFSIDEPTAIVEMTFNQQVGHFGRRH